MNRTGIVGAGAIGCYYGAKLALHGGDVHFLMRGDVTGVRQRGIRIRGQEENFSLAGVNHYASTEEIGPCDLVLISVKTTSNRDLLKLIPPLLHQKTMLLTLQNGFGNEEFLATNFGEGRVLGALCFVCVNRISPGVIDLYHRGRVWIGEYQRGPGPRAQSLANEFRRCDVICGVVENLTLERWRKLVWNIPFNGLSIAAGGVDTAVILSDRSLRRECIALMEEVLAAAQACGFSLPVDTIRNELERTETMGAYKPSTLVDFQSGRPLEIEAIWGESLRRAEAAGADTPRLGELYATLKTIDSARRDPLRHR